MQSENKLERCEQLEKTVNELLSRIFDFIYDRQRNQTNISEKEMGEKKVVPFLTNTATEKTDCFTLFDSKNIVQEHSDNISWGR